MRPLAAALLLAAFVEPQPPAPPDRAAATAMLERLAGSWTGSGTILGQSSTVDMQWTPVLDSRFVRLTVASHIGPPPKTQHFEGHAYYEVRSDGRVRATWFDSSGLTRPVDATVSAASLVATWGTPDTEVGETTYRLVSDRTLEVVDRVRGKDGTWQTFGRSTLSRTLPPR